MVGVSTLKGPLVTVAGNDGMEKKMETATMGLGRRV